MLWADMVANTTRPGKPELATNRKQVEPLRETDRTGGQRVETTDTEQVVTHKRTQKIPENAEMSDDQMAI
jgi:hypothetical protein